MSGGGRPLKGGLSAKIMKPEEHIVLHERQSRGQSTSSGPDEGQVRRLLEEAQRAENNAAQVHKRVATLEDDRERLERRVEEARVRE